MGAVSSRLDAGAARSGKRGKQEQGWRGCFSEEVRAACCSCPVPCAPQSVCVASSHRPSDSCSARLPAVFPHYLHGYSMHRHPNHPHQLLPGDFALGGQMEVLYMASHWRGELAWRDQPQINQNRHFGCPAFLSEGCCGLTPAGSSEPPALTLCVGKVDALKGVSGK